MSKNLRTCCVCHNQYEYCNICHKELPTWMFSYCCENCKDIYKITSSYENGQIDAKTANEKLSKLDLSKKDNFGESYKNTLKKISVEVKKMNSTETSKIVKNEKTEIIENSDKVFKNPVKKKGFRNVE